MSLHMSRRVGRHKPARPSGRHLWTGRALLATSSVLVGWAGVSIFETREVEQVSASSAEIAPVRQGDPLRPERMFRKEPLVIEPPLQRSARPFKTAGVAVQRPEASPEPVAIRIPNLGIDQDLTELAVIGNDLQVPDDYSDIGWWRGGPVPGRDGAAVVVGHVDSPTGPAVFYQLSGLVPGDLIEVERDDGLRTVFKVAEIQVYDKAELPSRRVYRPGGDPALHLLTCGGSFDAEVGQYSSNVVVYAPLVRRIEPEGQKKQDHGEQDHAETGHGESDHGESDHGESDHGETDHGDTGHGETDHGDTGHGDTGHGDTGHGEEGQHTSDTDSDRETASVPTAASLLEADKELLLRQLQDLFDSPQDDALVRDVRKLFEVKERERP